MAQRIVVDNAVAVNDDESETAASYSLTPAPTATQRPEPTHGLTHEQLQATAAGAYSTGRGGAGNIVSRASSSPSHSPSHERAGGFFARAAHSRSRSRSREPTSPGARSRSRDHGAGGLWDRLTHPHLSAPTHAPDGAKEPVVQDYGAEPLNRGRRVDVPTAIAE
jgi:hypothetical protein